jgi:cytochrome c oxidase subunit III
VTDQLSVHEPYAESAQQRETDLFGMYLFLATEIMLFGGFLAVVYVYRIIHPNETAAAARHLKLWLGGANTAVLLTSSLFVALAVANARAGDRRATSRWLVGAVALGVGFLAIKSYEYWDEYREGLMPRLGPPSPLADGPGRLFIDLYFVGTSLHAIHLMIGIGLVLGLAWRVARRRTRLPERAVTVEAVGLYWHLVDVVWVFIYPVLYLARG